MEHSILDHFHDTYTCKYVKSLDNLVGRGEIRILSAGSYEKKNRCAMESEHRSLVEDNQQTLSQHATQLPLVCRGAALGMQKNTILSSDFFQGRDDVLRKVKNLKTQHLREAYPEPQ